MNNIVSSEFSRQIATAQTLANSASDCDHFFDKAVLLTGDPEFLKTNNGRWIFIDSVLLLIRMTKRLTVEVRENDDLAKEIATILSDHTKHHAVITTTNVDYHDFEAILSAGSMVEPDLPWTAINSNGWVARVSSVKSDLAGDCHQANPVGALAAACLGVTEVFKRIVKLRPERGGLHDNLAFSFYSYSAEDVAGPEISRIDVGNLLLIGAGAIGNGICQLLRQLPMEGLLSIVDYQEFREENLGTCVLVSVGDLGRPKAEVLAEGFNTHLRANGYAEDLSTFVRERIGREIPFPRIVLTAVDNIDARREAQTIWPDIAIDGAIGALSCEVTLHPWGPDLSCLMCDFEHPTVSAAKVQSDLTGLPEDRLSNLLDAVTNEDVRRAPPAKKQLLTKYVGKQICAVLSDIEMEGLSDNSHGAFQPSVPFVACLSSCMIVTELLRSAANGESVLDTGYQFDVLVGPQNGIRKAHARKNNCVCVNRRDVIDKLRAKRSS